MTVYVPAQSEAAALDKLFKDDPTTVELVLCLSASWSNPPTEAEIVASIIAETQGYTHQDVTPASGATVSSNVATITFANSTMSVTSSTLDYTGAAIIIDQGLASEAVAWAKKFDTTYTLDSAGNPHPFNNIQRSSRAIVN